MNEKAGFNIILKRCEHVTYRTVRATIMIIISMIINQKFRLHLTNECLMLFKKARWLMKNLRDLINVYTFCRHVFSIFLTKFLKFMVF